MLLISRIRENHKEIIKRLKIRGLDVSEEKKNILSVDSNARSMRTEMEAVQASQTN